MNAQLIPLELLRAGEWAEVAEVHGEAAWVGRMAELGLRAASRLKMIRSGSPCMFQIGGARLSLRGEELMRILVRPLAGFQDTIHHAHP